jgi:glycosyltransferase involved in cell wall biosynthesis
MSAVTILLPTYNRAQYLPLAIRSALAQTHTNFRLIILDDASPDNTAEVVQPFLSDPRVRYIRHPQNLGITGNWRAGLKLVDTEFFCLLEDDDLFLPNYLEQMLVPLQQDPELILSFCDHWFIDGAGKRDNALTEQGSRRFGRHRLKAGVISNFARTAIIDGSIGITATVFRSAHVTPDFIRDEASGGIDFWLLYQCARTGRSAYYIADRLMEYRIHGGGMSHTMPERMAIGHLFLYQQVLAQPDAATLHSDARRELHEIATSYGIHLLLTERQDEAVTMLGEALRHGGSLRARLSYALARWHKGEAAAHSLRRAKQQVSQSLVPFLEHATLLLLLVRGVRHLPMRIFFRG